MKFEAIAPRSCHACVFSSSFSYLRCHHHWTEIKIIMDYFIFTINRNRLFPSFVASFFALFLSASYGPCFVFSLSVCADQVILLCASVARSSHVHVPLSLSISLSFSLCSFSSLFFFINFYFVFRKAVIVTFKWYLPKGCMSTCEIV